MLVTRLSAMQWTSQAGNLDADLAALYHDTKSEPTEVHLVLSKVYKALQIHIQTEMSDSGYEEEKSIPYTDLSQG